MVAKPNVLIVPTHAYACLLSLLLVVLVLIWLDTSNELAREESSVDPQDRHLVCYYTFNDTYLVPELIDPSLCTHINVGFADIEPSNHSISLDDWQLQLLSRVTSTTSQYKNVQTLISVGGAGLSNFGTMVANHANRKLFIRSLMALLKKYKLDGVDIDWEWPVIDGGSKQKVQFIQLLREIRVEFDRHEKKYTLTAAVAAAESIVSASYYVEHIAEYVDFVNVMTYDYHFFNQYYPVTDFNAPLYADPSDAGGALQDFNVNYTVHLWLSLGMPPSKIVLGLPSYGHTYRLRNGANHGRLAPADGFGFGTDGFATYPEVCQFVLSSPFVTVVHDTAARVPYAYDYNYWVSYDDVESLSEKVEFAKHLNIGGVMFYSLNADDYTGNFCSLKEKFPLLRAVHSKLYER